MDIFVAGFGLGCVPLLGIVIYALVRGAWEERRHPWTGPRGRGVIDSDDGWFIS